MERWIIMIIVVTGISTLEVLFTHLITYLKPSISALKADILGFLAAGLLAVGLFTLLRFFLLS